MPLLFRFLLRAVTNFENSKVKINRKYEFPYSYTSWSQSLKTLSRSYHKDRLSIVSYQLSAAWTICDVLVSPAEHGCSIHRSIDWLANNFYLFAFCVGRFIIFNKTRSKQFLLDQVETKNWLQNARLYHFIRFYLKLLIPLKKDY